MFSLFYFCFFVHIKQFVDKQKAHEMCTSKPRPLFCAVHNDNVLQVKGCETHVVNSTSNGGQAHKRTDSTNDKDILSGVIPSAVSAAEVAKRSTAVGSRSTLIGVRGFESLPPHCRELCLLARV